MEYTEYEFKNGKKILSERFPEVFQEILEVLKNFNCPLGRNVKPTASKELQRSFTEIKKDTASLLEYFSCVWQKETPVFPGAPLKYDLFRGKIAIEIQLTDPADCYNDYFKFLLGYKKDTIKVGVEIVYDDSCKGEKFKNVPTIGKVKKDLEIFQDELPCPMWVIGLKE